MKLDLEEEAKAVADVEQGDALQKGKASKVDPPAPDVTAITTEGKQPAAACAVALRCNPGVLTLLSKYPHLLIAPVILFCLIVALCSFGIVHATNASYKLEGERARDTAISAADGIAKQLSSASRAALSMAAVVKMNPNWSFLESNFQVLAEELFRQSNHEGNLVLKELAFIPFGRVRINYGDPITRNSTADMFSPQLVDQLGPYRSIKERGLTVNGPISLTNTEDRAFAARYPVFFPDTDEDESWGHPDNITHPTGCPGPPCYNPKTREKWWGFIGALVNAEPLLAGDNVHLKRLLSDDLSYSLTTSFLAGTNGPGTLVSGGPNPDKVTANVTVNLPGTSWALSVHNPRQDQILKLRDGLLAMVVVAAFILSVLLLLLLLSAKRASVLLQEQLATNKLLQEEKVSREALLSRQFDLLACLEQSTRPTKKLSVSKLSHGQLNTLDRIATAKAAISDLAPRKDEDIQVQELLAEGSFGKVYKGKWRGADVAVKIILFPGNMSGREKREKMVVWEAAISSSLVHPNVCQTYHYRIKPVQENPRSASEMGNAGSPVGLSDASGSNSKSGIQTGGLSWSSGPQEVHSYEVQLVIEYCDCSSLRVALDAGLFMTPDGMNYAAQLDCAMDVAKAMLHLHCNNVLHLDLKTHNILLASSGAEGKGVICKVSDFGLSVRMDHLETHVSSLFHGTMTHMAPEVMLKGTCSKASDVYAFGVVLWELYTGSSAFREVPPALLGHLVVKDAKRPAWPASVPKGYRDLANACWDQNPDARPTFEVILEELCKLRKGLGIPTPPLQPYSVRRPQSKQPHFQEAFTSASQPSLALSRDSKDFLQTKGPSTPSQAEALLEAWLQPRGKKGSFPAKGPSTPVQPELLHPMGTSAPPQALPHTSMGALQLKAQEGAASASLVREEERKIGSTSLAHEKVGQGGLNQPQSSGLQGDPPPLGPKAPSALPLCDPHAVMSCPSGDSHGSDSSSKGGCHAAPNLTSAALGPPHATPCHPTPYLSRAGPSHSEPSVERGNTGEPRVSAHATPCHPTPYLSRAGPSHSEPSVERGDAGELLVPGAEGDPAKQMSHCKVSRLHGLCGQQ